MNFAKVQLSEEELALVQNAEWLLTKNRIIAKVYEMFGALAEDYRSLTRDSIILSDEIFQSSPKIFRGENYHGLPYVMLDYPRCFGKEDIFAIRTMFWWGNYFSITLHLKGVYKKKFLPILVLNSSLLAANTFFIGINENEWLHEISAENYQPIYAGNDEMFGSLLQRNEFSKIAAKVDLTEWSSAPARLKSLYEILCTKAILSFPIGETGL